MVRARVLGAMAAVAALVLPVAVAAQQTVTVVSFGGSYQDSLCKALYTPTAQKLGYTIKEDSLRGIADVRLQAKSGKTTWDIVDVGRQYCMSAEAAELFEPLDYSLIPNAKDLPAGLQGKNWLGGPVYYSMVLGWNKTKYKDNPPQSFRDFFDTTKFPGTRALYGQSRFMLEVALLGDGVAPDKIYPIDVDRALKKIADFKRNVTAFYTSHGQAVQMVKDKEVDIIAILDGRADAAIKDGADLAITYNGGIIDAGCFGIVKGAPNKQAAMRVLNEFISADFQANIPNTFFYGPINPKAYATGKISPALAASLNSSPDNLKKQMVLGSEWWAENEAKVQPRWDATIVK